MGASEQTQTNDEGRARERIVPDRAWLARVLASGGEDLRKCMQCATCSVVCELADARNPGPRKEMLWAQWGLRDRLMSDPDLWLCHQCGDCTQRCPRGARPGDVMAALRRECVIHYATPRAFGRWTSRPASLPWIVLLAAAFLFAGAVVWDLSGLGAAERAFTMHGQRMAFPFWDRLPHGLLAAVFTLLIGFDIAVLARGARHFWRAMNHRPHFETIVPSPRDSRERARVKGALGAALRRILWHDDFGRCTSHRARRAQHLLVIFGMAGLWLTSLWVVTARWNPLLQGLVYPLAFWNPWKVMANLAGLALVLGASLMLVSRSERAKTAGATGYSDATLLAFLLLIALTGFATESLHLARIDSLRHAAYAAHLILVVALLWTLPYSKLAHAVYRTLAMVHASRTGRGPK